MSVTISKNKTGLGSLVGENRRLAQPSQYDFRFWILDFGLGITCCITTTKINSTNKLFHPMNSFALSQNIFAKKF